MRVCRVGLLALYAYEFSRVTSTFLQLRLDLVACVVLGAIAPVNCGRALCLRS